MFLRFTGIGREIFPEATRAILDYATAMNRGAIPTAEQMKEKTIQVGKALNVQAGATEGMNRAMTALRKRRCLHR
jgi:hypothetical protein